MKLNVFGLIRSDRYIIYKEFREIFGGRIGRNFCLREVE